ncbi:tyrosine-type recombinase/integrase [Nocardioides aurantiacus]|uniref:Site-specific recombinase XerC n=1 Tax=Nocardioides aurantiacus TaxID=86796 RepID=A0A3N2CW54_9ACTN|nr:site-specific integrase [Nocardioides aurantiacus]ROR91713.1 site-specific recombinase XerC [Nocardioides aurantiacus]
MRQVREYVAKDGTKTHRVRYRLDGTEHSQTFRSKKDADTFAKMVDVGVIDALRWLADRGAGTPDGPTFAQFFETYVDQLTGVTIRTRDDYRAQKRRYLTELDPLPLPLITRGRVTSIVNRLEREGRSPKTIRNVVHMLSSCMGLALYDGHIARNPCHRMQLPKEGVNRDRARFLTHDEFGALYDAMPDHYQPLAAFMVGTGLRWSEATALYSRHVDLKAGTVRVEQAWKKVPGGWEIGPPKSAKSWRTVNAATGALAAAQPLLRRPRDHVFTTPNGLVVRHANFYNRVWQTACVDAGLGDWVDGPNKRQWEGPSPHDLRHTHASWLISDGQSLESVQDQLGHESILTTRKVYGHLLPAIGVEVGRSASAGLERALANRVQPLALG